MNIGYLSFRIAGTDGVSLEAERWKIILERMGHKVTFIAGELDQSGILIRKLHFSHPEIYEVHEALINLQTDYDKFEKTIFTQAGEIEGELRQIFKKIKFDKLIISNVFSLPIHFPLAVALERVINEFKIETISRNHDFWWERERYLKSDCLEFFKRFFPPVNNNITHVTINKIAQKELFERTGINSQVIADSFDFNSNLNNPDSFSNCFRSDFNLNESDIIFLQATRIVPRKNIEASIELVKKLNDPRIILVMAGFSGDESGDYLEKLKNQAKKAQIRTKFIGSQVKANREIKDGLKFYTLWDAFINCDFTTYPSTFEGFGNQFIEAVYFKKPILVNRYPVYVSDIEPLGFETVAINKKITKKTVEKVRNLLNNPSEVKKMVEKNYSLAKKHFSFEATQKKIEKLGILPKKIITNTRIPHFSSAN